MVLDSFFMNLLVRSSTFFLKGGACHHEIWGVLIEAKGHTSRPYYGKANAPACRCGGEHAVL